MPCENRTGDSPQKISHAPSPEKMLRQLWGPLHLRPGTQPDAMLVRRFAACPARCRQSRGLSLSRVPARGHRRAMHKTASPDRTAVSTHDTSFPPEQCPLCGTPNECQLATHDCYKGLCWCQKVNVTADALEKLPREMQRAACLCRSCLERLARGEKWSPVSEARRANGPALMSERDYYTDENGSFVFTAGYLSARGYCCGNGCRHCPY